MPIIFANVADPVADGLVESLAHPGGNITGITNYEYAITGKWVWALREAASQGTRILIIYHPENAAVPGQLRALETVASSFVVQLTKAGVHRSAEIEQAVVAFAREPNGGLIILPDAISECIVIIEAVSVGGLFHFLRAYPCSLARPRKNLG